MWKRYAVMAAVLTGITSWSAWRVYDAGQAAGRAQVQAQWQTQQRQAAQAMTEQLALARTREQALQAQAEQIQRERRHEVARLQRQHAAVLDGLRQRPERPAGGTGVPEAAGAAEPERACTGGELYREDGAFLIGEAARADEQRLQLVACQAAYEAAAHQLIP